MSIARLSVKAVTNFGAGYKIGAAFKEHFRERCASSSSEQLKQFYDSDPGRIVYENALLSTERCYPNIVQELRGLADGSELPFENLFLHSLASEIWLYYGHTDATPAPKATFNTPKKQENLRCTDILVNSRSCRIIGHNEDWQRECYGKCYVVDIDIDKQSNKPVNKATSVTPFNQADTICSVTAGNTKPHQIHKSIQQKISERNEQFVSFATPCELTGFTFAMNKYFVFTVNSLVPRELNTEGVPIGVLVRALMGARSIEECVKVMKNEPFGCCYGLNLNIASIHTNEMWSMEVYSTKEGSSVTLKQLPYDDSETPQNHYVHTNHYKYTPGALELYDNLLYSCDRHSTAIHHDTPKSVKDVCRILGDQSNSEGPIYRQNVPTDKSATLATGLFDLKSKLLHVFDKNPNQSDPCFSIPFLK